MCLSWIFLSYRFSLLYTVHRQKAVGGGGSRALVLDIPALPLLPAVHCAWLSFSGGGGSLALALLQIDTDFKKTAARK